MSSNTIVSAKKGIRGPSRIMNRNRNTKFFNRRNKLHGITSSVLKNKSIDVQVIRDGEDKQADFKRVVIKKEVRAKLLSQKLVIVMFGPNPLKTRKDLPKRAKFTINVSALMFEMMIAMR